MTVVRIVELIIMIQLLSLRGSLFLKKLKMIYKSLEEIAYWLGTIAGHLDATNFLDVIFWLIKLTLISATLIVGGCLIYLTFHSDAPLMDGLWQLVQKLL